jgi:hypothetical protein
MTLKERLRQAVTEPPSPEELQRRAALGWRLAAVEWERDIPSEEPSKGLHETPFGLKVADDCAHLEADPQETAALATMLRLVIQDEVTFSQVADELNRRGYRTRRGSAWTPISVYRLVPRLVEAAPEIYRSSAWR